MDKGINVITNEGLGFKLINSISFGESVFPVGFNQKTTKEDLIVKEKYRVPPWYLCGKTLEGSKSHVTEVEGHPVIGGPRGLGGLQVWPACPTWQPPILCFGGLPSGDF